MHSKLHTSLAALLVLAASLIAAAPKAQIETVPVVPVPLGKEVKFPAVKTAQPIVEVCFVLDTTGSMSGLIAGAKKKIWDIANHILSGKPRPKVHFSLVGYRDKGDAYVTKVFEMTDNIDKIYTELMKFQAGGGGDGPENVNQGLFDAINKVQWSNAKSALKIIYLVGDFPPHNEYKDVPTYDKLAKAAITKGIYINTVLCGNNAAARKVWIDIASRAEGSFIALAQDGGVQDIATPYDKDLGKLNTKLMGTAMVYGRGKVATMQHALNASAEGMARKKSEADGAAMRASVVSKSGRVANNDLLDAVKGKDGKFSDDKLRDMNEKKNADMLPKELRGKTVDEQKKIITANQTKRDALMKQADVLTKQRDAYVRKELAKRPKGKTGFDVEVVRSLQKQAAKKGIKYDAITPEKPTPKKVPAKK
jgi:Mg-chelatase subunit ChlD